MSFQIMAWAVKQKVGNATGKAILLMLANYADEKGESYPSQEKLATECECSVATVARWIKQLESDGFLRRKKQYGDGGYRRADRLIIGAENLPITELPSKELPNSVSKLTRHSDGADTIREPIKSSSLRSEEVEEAVRVYSEMANRTGLPKPRVISEARKRKIRAMLKTYSLDLWREAVAALGASSFCLGKNDRGWRADFDFLLQGKSFDGLIEGKYADKGKSAASQPDPNLVTLAQDDPDFLAVKRKRRAEEGRDVIVSATGKATISRAEVEQARKWAQEHDQDTQSQELAHAGSHH